jgi:GDP-L-fucose synthase
VTIAQLAQMIAKVTRFTGQIAYDRSKLDDAPRKLMDVSRIARMGWAADTSLEAGITGTYRWYPAKLASGTQMRAK